MTYEDTRAEVLAMLNELEQRSHQEPGLWDHWTKVRNPLVYLIDEIMILNCQWPHRQDWANDCLEVTLLGHPTALGGDSFYTECDEALHELELSERHERLKLNSAKSSGKPLTSGRQPTSISSGSSILIVTGRRLNF